MPIQERFISTLRWLFSVGFFFLALTKAGLILKHGLEPYFVIIDTAGLPEVFSYYGVFAVFIEFCFAIGVWYDKTYQPVIILAGALTFLGVVISISLLVFKVQSGCGCGLLGDNEYGLLAQKLVIITGLMFLHRDKSKLF